MRFTAELHAGLPNAVYGGIARRFTILKEEFNKTHTEGPNLPLETEASKSAVKGDTITKLPNKS